jgi:hypothetical protein
LTLFFARNIAHRAGALSVGLVGALGSGPGETDIIGQGSPGGAAVAAGFEAQSEGVSASTGGGGGALDDAGYEIDPVDMVDRRAGVAKVRSALEAALKAGKITLPEE